MTDTEGTFGVPSASFQGVFDPEGPAVVPSATPSGDRDIIIGRRFVWDAVELLMIPESIGEYRTHPEAIVGIIPDFIPSGIKAERPPITTFGGGLVNSLLHACISSSLIDRVHKRRTIDKADAVRHADRIGSTWATTQALDNEAQVRH